MTAEDRTQPGTGADGPRERIMRGALELVGERGAQGVTVREIAALADVNVAAVNYYFSSKHQLIAEALAYFVRGNVGVLDLLEDRTRPPFERLVAFMDAYTANLVAHPGVVRGLVHEMQGDGEVPEQLVETLRRGFTAMRALLAEISPEGEDLEMRVLQVFSSLHYPILLMHRLSDVLGLDLRDPSVRARYVRSLAEGVAR